MIRLTNINKTYYTEATSLHVLKGIDMTINTGEFVAITVHRVQKSTLLNILEYWTTTIPVIIIWMKCW